MQYNKGEKSLDELTFTSVPLSYTQKPAIFSAENEFRFVVIVTGKPSQWLDEDFLPIDLGHKLNYVEFCDRLRVATICCREELMRRRKSTHRMESA